jgi:hypothetical protein
MIYLREKRSGNFEISNKKEATVKIFKKNFSSFWNDNIKRRRKKIIKGTYSKSQTYFSTSAEFLNYIK